MVRVVFLPSPFWPREAAGALTAEAEPGEAVVDLCDDTGAPIPFSCRAGSCGTCYVEVVEGAELLDAVQADERLVLDTLQAEAAQGDRPRRRLACQAKVEGKDGVVRLRVCALREGTR